MWLWTGKVTRSTVFFRRPPSAHWLDGFVGFAQGVQRAQLGATEEMAWAEDKRCASPGRISEEGRGGDEKEADVRCFLTVSHLVALPLISTAPLSAGSLRKKSEKRSLSFVNTNINICTTERNTLLWFFSFASQRRLGNVRSGKHWWLMTGNDLCFMSLGVGIVYLCGLFLCIAVTTTIHWKSLLHVLF